VIYSEATEDQGETSFQLSVCSLLIEILAAWEECATEAEVSVSKTSERSCDHDIAEETITVR